MKREDSLKRGRNNIEMLVLDILCEDDYYGYQLSQLIKQYSNGMISIPEGSLYPALYRMEDSGYISGKKRQVGKRMERIYYHIEPLGKEYLEQLVAEYTHLHTAIANVMHRSKEESQ